MSDGVIGHPGGTSAGSGGSVTLSPALFSDYAKGRRAGLLEAARLARDHDIGEDAKADRALDTLAEKLERLAGESE